MMSHACRVVTVNSKSSILLDVQKQTTQKDRVVFYEKDFAWESSQGSAIIEPCGLLIQNIRHTHGIGILLRIPIRKSDSI
jgi:hypothetical protein